MTKLETFIRRANAIHQDEYDYRLVEYTNTHTKVDIVCAIHGIFSQTPSSHVNNKSGCPQCSNTKRKQTNIDRYGVENYTQTSSMQDIIKSKSLEKYGVDNPRKSKEVQAKIKQTMLDRYGVEYFTNSHTFKDMSHQTKLDRYDNHHYNNITKAKLTCLDKYGVDNPRKSKEVQLKIKQTMLDRYGVEYPLQHIEIKEKLKLTNVKKYGVSNYNQCHMLDILPLIEDYDWLVDQYIIQQKTATQIGFELGIDKVTILTRLHRWEIEINRTFRTSFKCIQWIQSIKELMNINIIEEYPIPCTNFFADGFCKETNTIYEFHGDYWHGNPDIYKPERLNTKIGCTMGELYQRTTERENKIKELGYNLVIKWETSI